MITSFFVILMAGSKINLISPDAYVLMTALSIISDALWARIFFKK